MTANSNSDQSEAALRQAILERDEMRRANITQEDTTRPFGQSVAYWQDRCLDHATALDGARVRVRQLEAALRQVRGAASLPLTLKRGRSDARLDAIERIVSAALDEEEVR